MRQPARIDGVNSVWGFLRSPGSDPVPQPSRITIKHAVARLLAGGLLCFSALAHATAPVGTTPGSFAVSPSGAATYSIPIFVPPGTNGMQPQLSLNYNSQGGNGLLGMGWALGGLSVIHRCGSTIAIDGIKGGVNYDANDKFCLDGERLINIGGTEYRTQHESWKKVSVVGSYFTVTAKDGTVMTYGGTPDSQILPMNNTSVTRIWALNRIQDRNGNYLTISYNNQGNASGEYYPTSIAYTGNVNAGVSPYIFIYFDYAARSDGVPMYEAGSLISTTQRLTGIRAFLSSTLVREYRLAYDPNGGAAGRSRLISIQECGSDGICLPATALGWQNGSVEVNNVTQWVQHGASEPGQMQYADVDGDGKMDSLYFDTSRSNQVWVGTSTGTTFVDPSPWVSYSPSTSAQIHYADVNGDGRADALYADTSGNRVLVSLSTGSVFSVPAEWAIFSAYGTTLDPAQVQYADVDGDGRADLIHQGSNNGFRVGLSSGAGFGSLPLWVQHGGSFVPGQAQYADIDGDGKADLIFQDNSNAFWVSLSTGTGFTASSTPWAQHGGSYTAGQARYADVNGDGKADLVFQGNDGWLWVSLSTGTGFTTSSMPWAQPATSSRIIGSQVFTTVGPMSFTVPYGITSLKITVAGGGGGGSGGNDAVSWGAGGGGGGGYSQQPYGPVTPGQVINGFVGSGGPAGCWGNCSGTPGGDTVFGALIATGGGGGEFGDPWTGGYGGYPGGQQGQTQNYGGGGAAGAGQGAGGGAGQPGGLYGGGGGAWNESSSDDGGPGAQGWIKVEWDSSSYSQVQYADANGDGMADAVYLNMYDNSIWVYLSTGAGFLPGILWGQLGSGASLGSQMRYADVNGDGLPDALYFDTFQSNGVWVGATKGVPPDLLASATHGLGAQTTVTYKPLTDGTVYDKDSGASYPYQNVQDATYVVSDTYQSNGVSAGTNKTSYRYRGLLKHHTAHSSLGFRNIDTTDVAGLATTLYLQTLDGTEGAVWQSWRYTLQGAPVHELYNTWTPVNLGSGRTLALLSDTAEGSLDPDIFFTYLTQTTTTYSSFDSYYNPQTITVSTSDGFTKTTTNTYNNDFDNWQLGKLTYSKVTGTAPGQGSDYRESSFTYDSLGRVLTEVVEPYRSTLTLTTTYGYDSFGNRTSKTVSGPGIVTRDEYILIFDARGQFVTSKTNALGHIERFENMHPTGALTKYTDANNLITTSTYDGFGRKESETRPDGTTTTINYGAWPGGTYAQTVTSGAGENYVYNDILGRPVQANTQGFGGNWIYKETQYDSLGRVSKVSHPYFAGETKHYTEYSYDTLGRVKTVTEPSNRVTTTDYNGLTTTVANPLGQQKTTVKNSQGQVVSSTDAAGTAYYQYDPFGNLVQVTGVDGAVTSMTYDERGRKIAMTDPDMGAWTYTYDALGQLKSQKDAKGQTMSMGYDKLGRMIWRTTPDSFNSFTYDTAAYGKGKLAAVSGGSASETYVYDSLSRVSSMTTSVGGIPYTTGHTYDAYSRPLTLTYPETGFKLYHVYDPYGHLTEVRQDSATGLRYWKADTFDAHGRLTQETFGNNLISSRAYDHATGDLFTILTGTIADPYAVQFLYYEFDPLDNLTTRADYINSVTELFDYDNLNRLTAVTGPANKTYSYYPNGNIKTKSDVGQYTYGGPQPHAVTSVAGALNASYTYDANGNMLSGNGRTMTYTSYNKVKTIVKGSTTDTFTYDANFNRLTKTTGSSAFTYIGKLYENIQSGTSITQNHFLYAGSNLVGLYRKYSNGTASTVYFHTDHLGSVDTMTNATGGVSARYGYDAHGKRRNANGADLPLTSCLTGARRGYTRHEHDDEICLVNMNAREYDYVIGRFISPDTVIPGATNSQSYNRYSYVNNNPLSYTDPTGQSRLSRKIRKVVKRYGRMAVAAVAAYYTAGAASSWFMSSAGGSAFATSAFASGNITAAYAAQTSIYIGGGIVGGAAAGYTAGYTITGDPGAARQGAKGGAIAGGLFAGADLMNQNWNSFGQITSRATAGGLSANAQGGQFDQGFRFSFATGSASWLYESTVNYGATWESGGARVSKTRLDPPVAGANNVGLARQAIDPNSWVDRWFAEGGYVSRALNVVPGGNAVAGMHDAQMVAIERWGGPVGFGVLNLPMVPIAGALTAPALFDGPVGFTTYNCMQHGCGY